jgi:hypothetical protein
MKARKHHRFKIRPSDLLDICLMGWISKWDFDKNLNLQRFPGFNPQFKAYYFSHKSPTPNIAMGYLMLCTVYWLCYARYTDSAFSSAANAPQKMQDSPLSGRLTRAIQLCLKQAAHSPPTDAASSGFLTPTKKMRLAAWCATPCGKTRRRFLPRLAASISNRFDITCRSPGLAARGSAPARACAQHAARLGVKNRLMPRELAASVLPA